MTTWTSAGPGVGSNASDKISICWTCRDRGFPHEAIRFKRVQGRWVRFDYFRPSEPHMHKSIAKMKEQWKRDSFSNGTPYAKLTDKEKITPYTGNRKWLY